MTHNGLQLHSVTNFKHQLWHEELSFKYIQMPYEARHRHLRADAVRVWCFYVSQLLLICLLL
jgi:hypothetical protein